MKRLLAVLMVCLILCGCSDTADEIFGPITQALNPPTEPPALPPLPADDYPEGTAMVVSFEMGAEFEMLLNSYFAVLEVRGLNEAGKALLASIAPTGSYRNAIEIILSEAGNQALLEQEALITITAREVDEDAWHVGCHNILTWPIENYTKTIGITPKLQMNAPGPYFDDSTYQYTPTRDDGDHTTTICYAANGYGPQEMDCLVYDNGDYEERYYLTEAKEFLFCKYSVNGNFSSSHDSPTIHASYTLAPDGTVSGYAQLLDEEGNFIQTTDLYEDGSRFENYYEDGYIVKFIQELADGSRQEVAYFSNGMPKWSVTHDPDGSYSELEYYEIGTVKHEYTCNTDGSYFECDYYENGIPRYAYTYNTDGSSVEQYYDENGTPIDTPTE